MDVKSAILGRRTVHEFSGESVNLNTVKEALSLALWAPNHRHTHPWKFYLVGEKTKAELVDLAVEMKRNGPKAVSDIMLESLKAKLSTASSMVAIGMNRVDDEFTQREDYASVACGVQNASLYLHQQGIASKWSTGGFTRAKETYQILGIDPEAVEIVGVLLIGKEKEKLRVPPRPQLQSVLTELP